MADKANEKHASNTDPKPPKRDNPIYRTSKVSESETKPAGRAMSQKSARKASGHHHKK